ncbi:hypothetical protein [Nonomuraea sp. NPDC050786]|uniref:hypothetical protein n=1 Tax=Nonomuraea sp. NPDC050786 TaxID=3154840 RepID=UPI00340B518C
MTTKAVEPVDRALRQVETISAVGLALASMEYLARPDLFEDTGLMSWEVERLRIRMLAGKKADFLNVLFKPPGIYVLLNLRLVAALTLINPKSDRTSRDIAVAFIAVTNYLLAVRIRAGTDGTEHMSQLTYMALLAARLFPNDPKARAASAWFIGGQSMLSYLAAGLAKAAGPSWRQGQAMPGIFRTYVYGDERVYKILKDRPMLSKLAGWGVIVGESIVPLALILPKKSAWGMLAAGASFHAGNAMFMGLNRFLWSFVGTYPAVVYMSKHMNLDDVSPKKLLRVFRKRR